jgi:hypothetical protein
LSASASTIAASIGRMPPLASGSTAWPSPSRTAHLPPGQLPVEVVYSRRERFYKTHAKHCVLACWNMMIPYLCPQLPETQKQALHYLVKVPLVYTNVAISNW